MGKKENKKAAAAAAAAAAASEAEPTGSEETAPPWWEEEVRQQPVSVEGLSSRLYLVAESEALNSDLLEMLVAGVGTGVRRRFALLHLADALKLVPDTKRATPDVKKAKGKAGKGAAKGEKVPPPSGASPGQAMLEMAGEQLQAQGQLDLNMMALVVKQALLKLLEERRLQAGDEDTLVMPQVTAKAKPAKTKERSGKKGNAAKADKTDDGKESGKDKKEDKESEAFCETKQFSLRKRGEPVEPVYKDDEPEDGPDLYVLIIGCYDPALPRELEVCGVRIEAILCLGGEPCQLASHSGASSATAASRKSVAPQPAADSAAEFWSGLPAGLTPNADAPDLKDMAIAQVPVDRCRVQFATDAAAAADQLYTEVARQMYRHLTLRQLFDKYRQAVASVPVPDAPRAPDPPPEDESAELDPFTPEPPPPVPLDPCLGEPTEYRRLLENLPAETVTVALIVNALVEQVCAWAVAPPLFAAGPAPEPEPVSTPPRTESSSTAATPVKEDVSVIDNYALQTEFESQQVDTSCGPVLVHEEDMVNAEFFDWDDREVVLSTEHVLTQGVELQGLQARPPAPDLSLWRHHSARQQLTAEEGGPASEEAADLTLRQLMFESMYGVLAEAGQAELRPYPHPFLPVQSVCPDVQRLTAECGDGKLADDAKQLDSRDVLLQLEPRFAEYRVWEPLDRLTMAQQLCAARDSRQLLAAYHFGGDDGLYLVYGQPRVRRGSLSHRWSRRAHTDVGFRDFLDSVQYWPEVAGWLRRQYRELVAAVEPTELQSPEPEDKAAEESGPAAEGAPPPETGFQLPDSVFLVPGSIKYEMSVGPERKEDTDKEDKESPSKGKSEKKEKKPGKGHQRQRSGSKSARSEGETGTPMPPALSVVQFEIRPKSPDRSGLRQRPPSPVPPKKIFSGYQVELDRLLSLDGRRQRQYFNNGSHVTVARCQYTHGPAELAVTVCHGETLLTLHPYPAGGGENDAVGVLSGGVMLHPRPITCQQPLPIPTPPPTPPPPPDSPPSPRKSIRRRSPVLKDDRPEKKSKKADKKKDGKKGKEEKGGKQKGKKGRAQSVEEEPEVEEPTTPPPQPEETPMESRRVQSLTLSCPSGLVVELLPDPFWPGPEPRVRVVQYYVDADCRRRRVRVHLADGTLLLTDGDQPEDELVTVHTVDGGVRVLQWTAAGLVPVTEVTPAGRRIDHREGAPAEPRPLLSKLATDPVTRELYIQREDGVRAVIRPGGEAVLQFADGTRVTMTSPPVSSDDVSAEARPFGCSDYIVNESGWIGEPRLTWLLGARVTVDDAASDEMVVLTEHPRYAQVRMDQRRQQCQVRLPQGLLLEVGSAGMYHLTQPDGSQMQLDAQLLCFSTPAGDDRRPVVHTLRLGPPEPVAEPVSAQRAPSGDACDPPADETTVKTADPAQQKTPPEAAGPVAQPPAGNSAAAAAAGDQPSDTDVAPPAAAEPLPPLDILTETVDSDGVVWRVTLEGELAPAEPGVLEQLPEPLPLEVRRQLDAETLLPEPPCLFVLYREGDGVRLLPIEQADRYLQRVEALPDSMVTRTPHMADKELTVVRTFRPEQRPLADRWSMPYSEVNIVPPNLRCRNLRVLCPEEVPLAGATVWGLGNKADVATGYEKVRLPTGLVCTRELLVAPPLEGERRQLTLRLVHEARLRHRTGADARQLQSAPPVPTRPVQLYQPDRLLEQLVSARAHATAAVQAPAPRPREDSRQMSVCANAIRELDKIIIYRDMLKRNRFPDYFLTSDGREFLATLRQKQSDTAPPTAKRRRCEPPLRLLPASPQDDHLPEPVQVTCRPHRLDLGLVRPGQSVSAKLQLFNAAPQEVPFRVVPPAPPLGLLVRPECGVLAPSAAEQVQVQFSASAQLHSRSLFYLLALVVGEVERLHVPVVACVAGGGCVEVLRDARGA